MHSTLPLHSEQNYILHLVSLVAVCLRKLLVYTINIKKMDEVSPAPLIVQN